MTTTAHTFFFLVIGFCAQYRQRATQAFQSARTWSRSPDNRPLPRKLDLATSDFKQTILSARELAAGDNGDKHIVLWKQKCEESLLSRRRLFCNFVAIGVAGSPSVASALDVDDRWSTKLNRLVTQSDLGISVRKSIVRGAQVMDQIDRGWEQFSDAYGLGYQRSQQAPFPEPRKDIPTSTRPLDKKTASALLNLFDQTFLSLLPSVSASDLGSRIRRLQDLVRPSFERASPLEESGGELFNFECYTRFRVYNEIIGELSNNKQQPQNLTSFRRKWEDEVGRGILQLFLSFPVDSSSSDDKSADDREAATRSALITIDRVNEALQSRGFVSLAARNTIDVDRWQDFVEDLDYLPLTVEVYGDVTLQSQILLQEQGYRYVYPALCRWAIAAALRQSPLSSSWKVSTDEYYMDTQYNANPEDYQVREILINATVE